MRFEVLIIMEGGMIQNVELSVGVRLVMRDYDVDGVCSSAILSQFFASVRANSVATLPNRMLEGYGLIQRLLNRRMMSH